MRRKELCEGRRWPRERVFFFLFLEWLSKTKNKTKTHLSSLTCLSLFDTRWSSRVTGRRLAPRVAEIEGSSPGWRGWRRGGERREFVERDGRKGRSSSFFSIAGKKSLRENRKNEKRREEKKNLDLFSILSSLSLFFFFTLSLSSSSFY